MLALALLQRSFLNGGIRGREVDCWSQFPTPRLKRGHGRAADLRYAGEVWCVGGWAVVMEGARSHPLDMSPIQRLV